MLGAGQRQSRAPRRSTRVRLRNCRNCPKLPEIASAIVVKLLLVVALLTCCDRPCGELSTRSAGLQTYASGFHLTCGNSWSNFLRLADAPSTSQKVWTTSERATTCIVCRQSSAQMRARLFQFRICPRGAADADGTELRDRQRSATSKIPLVCQRAIVCVREDSSVCAISDCASFGSTIQLNDMLG